MLTALRFSIKDMAHDLSRTALSVIGLAVVIASFFILSALAEVFHHLLSTTIVNPNLIIIQNDMIDPSDAVLELQVIQAAEELIPEMVSRVSPVIFRHIRVDGHIVQLRAADIGDWEPVFHLTLVEGSWPAGNHEVVVGEDVAQSNLWDIGSQIEIFGSEFTIAGVFRAPGTAFASVWMTAETFDGLFDIHRGYQALFVQVAKDLDPETVRLRLQNDARLANQYAVYFEDNYTRRNIEAHIDLSSMLTVVSRIALLGIVFGIFNATSLGIAERARELGILLGVGFSHRTVRRFILLRSLLQGGLSFGFGFAIAYLYITIQGSIAPMFILGLPMNLKITPLMTASGFAWVISLAFLGAWWSTRGFFNFRIVELLRSA